MPTRPSALRRSRIAGLVWSVFQVVFFALTFFLVPFLVIYASEGPVRVTDPLQLSRIGSDLRETVSFWTSAGTGFLENGEWFLPSMIAILVGAYASDYGARRRLSDDETLLGLGTDTALLNRIISITGSLIAATAVIFAFGAICASLAKPDKLGGVLPIATVTFWIAAFGIALGIFDIGAPARELQSSVRSINRLARYRRKAMRPDPSATPAAWQSVAVLGAWALWPIAMFGPVLLPVGIWWGWPPVRTLLGQLVLVLLWNLGVMAVVLASRGLKYRGWVNFATVILAIAVPSAAVGLLLVAYGLSASPITSFVSISTGVGTIICAVFGSLPHRRLGDDLRYAWTPAYAYESLAWAWFTREASRSIRSHRRLQERVQRLMYELAGRRSDVSVSR